MSSINDKFRETRFAISEKHSIFLKFQDLSGETKSLKILNVSRRGVATTCDLSINTEQVLLSTEILYENSSEFIGRVYVKRSDDESLAFLLMDRFFPMDKFSKCFDKKISAKDMLDYELSSDHFNISNFIEENSNIDLFGKTRKFSKFHEKWKRNNLYQYEQIKTKASRTFVEIHKMNRNKNYEYIQMGSNDYLGMSTHPKVLEEAKKAIDKFGFGSTGSHYLTGHCSPHKELSDFLAHSYNKDKCILFSSGYAANIGAISALCTPNDLVVADILSHGSIYDGISQSSSKAYYYLHNNMGHFEKILRKNRENYCGALSITEGIFSMEGTIGDIGNFYELSKEHNTRTFIDEAHAIGVLGQKGLGAAEEFGLLDDIDLVMGNLSKSLGSIGGFICCSNDLYSWLMCFSRSRLFSTSIPPAAAMAALAAAKLIFEESDEREKLRSNIRFFIDGLRSLDIPIQDDHRSAIVPIIIKDYKILGLVTEGLSKAGISVYPIVFPSTSRTKPRLRFTVCSTHTEEQLAYVVSELSIQIKKHNVDVKI